MYVTSQLQESELRGTKGQYKTGGREEPPARPSRHLSHTHLPVSSYDSRAQTCPPGGLGASAQTCSWGRFSLPQGSGEAPEPRAQPGNQDGRLLERAWRRLAVPCVPGEQPGSLDSAEASSAATLCGQGQNRAPGPSRPAWRLEGGRPTHRVPRSWTLKVAAGGLRNTHWSPS